MVITGDRVSENFKSLLLHVRFSVEWVVLILPFILNILKSLHDVCFMTVVRIPDIMHTILTCIYEYFQCKVLIFLHFQFSSFFFYIFLECMH